MPVLVRSVFIDGRDAGGNAVTDTLVDSKEFATIPVVIPNNLANGPATVRIVVCDNRPTDTTHPGRCTDQVDPSVSNPYGGVVYHDRVLRIAVTLNFPTNSEPAGASQLAPPAAQRPGSPSEHGRSQQ